MQSRIGCTCLTFLHCTFSNDPSNSVPEKRYSRIGCICLIFLHCAFYTYVASNDFYKRTHSRICCRGRGDPNSQNFSKITKAMGMLSQTTFTFHFSILNIVKCFLTLSHQVSVTHSCKRRNN